MIIKVEILKTNSEMIFTKSSEQLEPYVSLDVVADG